MGLSLVQEQSLDYPFGNYRKAILSICHIAFLDIDNRYVFALDEKESLKSALYFYQNQILTHDTYPVYNGKTFIQKPSDDKEVLRQVLGIPSCVFEKLDLRKDILPQLNFDKKLNEGRKTIYRLYYGREKKNWYRDDFKLFCLRKGIYFLYDETQPFVQGRQKELPVYFQIEKFDPYTTQPLYEQAKSSRIAIDFLGQDVTEEMVIQMEKLDRFSLSDRVDYFVNDHFQSEIADLKLNEEFKTKYGYLLRQYIASMINVLYDQYSFSVLNKVSAKMSFMSQSVVNASKRYYVLSSYQGDMFSTDRENWFFSETDRERIKNLVEMTFKDYPEDSILCFYARLGLPYVGYKAIRHLKHYQPQQIMECFPFKKTRDRTLRFLSAKRFDTYYSYLTGEKEHRFVFLKRILREQGFIYSVSKPFEKKYTLPLSLYIQDKERIPELNTLLSPQGYSLSENIFLAYQLDEGKSEFGRLLPVIEIIDEISNRQACREFYSSCIGVTLEMAVEKMLSRYQTEYLITKDLLHFFRYVFFYPFKIALAQYRHQLMENNDSTGLILLDRYVDQEETYEPNLPYPFVTWGPLCYSFRETLFSTPFVCSSEKEAIASSLSFYARRYDQISQYPSHDDIYFALRNVYVIQQVGLPKNIKALLNPHSDLLDQIPFKDHICHRCLDAEPVFNETNVDNLSFIPGWTYFVSEGARKGLYLSDFYEGNRNADSVISELISSHRYHALIEYDPALISPILLPYLHSDRKSITALLASTFPSEFLTDQANHLLSSFIDLGEDKIHHLLFDCREEDYPDLMANGWIFNLFVIIYRFVSHIYPIKVCENPMEDMNIPLTFNDDDNERLPFPHILLGRIFNAYQSKRGDKNFYFCSCDKEPIRSFLRTFYLIAEENHVRKDIETPLILALTGLPYETILALMDYDFSVGSVDDFVENRMQFRDSICRRCANINHAALTTPFFRCYPFKNDQSAEWAFARNALAHDGVMLVNSTFSLDIHYRPDYRFNLDSDNDEMLPMVYISGKDPKVEIYQFFVMDYDTLKDLLYRFSQTQQNKAEAAAYASGVILDSYQENHELFYQFFLGGGDTLRKSIDRYFPQIQRVRSELMDETRQMILLFINYLLNELIEHYARKEAHVGR